jgi:hypothetical protein
VEVLENFQVSTEQLNFRSKEQKRGESQQDLEHTSVDDEQATELKLFHKRQKLVQQKKEQLASLCAAILEDPENNFSDKIEKIQALASDPHEDNTIRKLAILSQCAMFKDILPRYG